MADALVSQGPGRPFEHSQEEIDRALYEIARQAGSTRKAAAALSADGVAINESTIRHWKTVTHRNRYSEIATKRSSSLDELIASEATEIALQASDVEKLALKQVRTGLSDADGLEASMILRNVTSSKTQQIDKAGHIRGRPTQVIKVEGLEDLRRIQAQLVRLGAADVVDSEAEVVEEIDPGPEAEAS